MATAKPKVVDPSADFDTPVKRQEALPGMENRGILELEEAARKYAAIRDKRMALNDPEVKLKDLLLGLLKKHDKRKYHHDGIRIWIKVEEETVKVKIEEEEEPSAIREQAHTGTENRDNQGKSRKRAKKGSQDGGADRQAEGETQAPGSPSEADEDVPF